MCMRCLCSVFHDKFQALYNNLSTCTYTCICTLPTGLSLFTCAFIAPSRLVYRLINKGFAQVVTGEKEGAE